HWSVRPLAEQLGLWGLTNAAVFQEPAESSTKLDHGAFGSSCSARHRISQHVHLRAAIRHSPRVSPMLPDRVNLVRKADLAGDGAKGRDGRRCLAADSLT